MAKKFYFLFWNNDEPSEDNDDENDKSEDQDFDDRDDVYPSEGNAEEVNNWADNQDVEMHAKQPQPEAEDNQQQYEASEEINIFSVTNMFMGDDQ